MSRVISIWLPFWKTDRLSKQANAKAPLAVIAAGKGGKRVIALNRAGIEAGLRTSMLLTDACAMLPSLAVIPQDEQGEAADLKRLATACNRFSPWTAPDEPDGLWIEATGMETLFGSEEELLRRVLRYLRGLGLSARAAIAGTPGAAWALARFSRTEKPVIAASGEEARVLARLPVKALRLNTASATLLDRLGLKTIGQLLDVPRAALRARFGKAITCRLDQALGENGEALSPLMPEPVYAARAEFTDPLTASNALERTARRLIEDVCTQLADDGKGARRFMLMLFDTENGVTEVALRMARAGCEATHIAGLLRERLATLEGRFDPTLGFDAVALYAMGVEALHGAQVSLLDEADDWRSIGECFAGRDQTSIAGPFAGRDQTSIAKLFAGRDQTSIAAFVDRITARLGGEAVTRFAFKESHWPERAACLVPVLAGEAEAVAIPISQPRPLTLLPRPEPITAIAAVPDYPPRQFVWRRCHHKVTRAEGPERISPEWWHLEDKTPLARDYYLVEDDKGRRFWLYREGVYSADGGQRWFMHGMLA